ncbi:MAG: DUF2911 domain-containing protein [Rhodothermales bacterium]|nr:DUF2911 domain-containing protein [Rhodothermales bacterium]
MIRPITLLLASFVLLGVHESSAQIRSSPRGSVSQTIDGTTIHVDYGRPALRGRDIMFGGQVHWGHIWTPGADDATTLEIDSDVLIDSVEVPEGKYSVWFDVQPDDWTLVLNPEWDLFHLPEPEVTDDMIQIPVTPDTTAPRLEVLTFDFPAHEPLATTLRFRWVNTVVQMRIDVPSRLQLHVTEGEVAPYTGVFHTKVLETAYSPDTYEYDMTFKYEKDAFWAAMQWGPAPADSTSAPADSTGSAADSSSSMPNEMDMQLLPRVEQIFYPVFFEDGQIVASADFFFEFLMGEDGRAESFELRTPDDELWMRGRRIDE